MHLLGFRLVLGQALTPLRRVLGISAAGACVLAFPAMSGADPSQTVGQLRAENTALESRSRSAVLSLYALDSRLDAARVRLLALRAQATQLRLERHTLTRELRIAKVGRRVSQQRLASRIRLLYDHGTTGPLEILFGAKTLDEALVEIETLDRVTSINQDVLTQLRSARARIDRASHALAVHSARLAAATRAQTATTRALTRARAERATYVADLTHRLENNLQRIDRIESDVRAAELRTRQLSVAVQPQRTPLGIGAPPVTETPRGRTLTVTVTAYALSGRTATGIPAGWGVVAVDPRVIPLGTHMTIPGYGSAVAADVGGSVVGTTIDVWFPTAARASAWGRRSVTISLH
jgi:3D (Asp-Asp-Asp) domain-containing protein